MNVLFTTNFPAPYRVDFFNELGQYCDLTVVYERKKALHRDEKWVGNPAVNFKEVYLKLKPVGTSQSRGIEMAKYISENEFDIIVFGGYASPAVMLSIQYCKLKKKYFYIECDGGFYRKDSFIKGLIKKYLFKSVNGFFITCEDTEKYLASLGVSRDRMFFYPFSSVYAREIIDRPLTYDEKKQKKNELGINEKVAIISVGQFIHRKGFDVLLNAFKSIDKKIGLYIIGGVPTKEYISICRENNLNNVHFLPFCKRDELFEWYKACDLFVFPTREDVWGLVINEAMACGLPIISSNMCIAARELIDNGENGIIYENENSEELAECINKIINEKLNSYSRNCLQKIRQYTIETMAKAHMEIWKDKNVNR